MNNRSDEDMKCEDMKCEDMKCEDMKCDDMKSLMQNGDVTKCGDVLIRLIPIIKRLH
jgi:hypothetical protein